ncbi:heavy metal translocating P-type ATPase [Haloarcula nitratireducens]|uniref:Cation-translocating P-type ATPase n=1 Tax=Haloarcula nitratireducens TaxID=2487749 RepID=A0AAW4PI99_9EURY|nr:cation-translocating P-type ATPase [Halomicroarcula nitratireducens]MBX0298161.1 cation-translocating P-type ATPase [Halomicroarcula nitratireducens]
MTANTDTADQTSGDGQRQSVTARLAVPEMDCPSCAQKVDKGLQRVDGIIETTLQPTTGTATIRYDPDRTSETDVVAAIEAAGYEVVGGSDDETDEPAAGVDIAPPSDVWTSPRAKKTWVGAVFVTLGLLFEFGLTGQNFAIASLLDHPLTIADMLFLGAVVASGSPVIRGGYYSAKNRSLDIDLLMGTAIIAATGIGYFVEAATLAVLFSIAELLEDYAMDRARDSLRELMELSPDEATVKRDGEAVTIPADDVQVGEIVVVRPGDKIPLDGTVVDGTSAVDESPITGESVPVDKREGDEVYAGAINEEGYLEVEVTSLASESTLSQIIEMVQGAQAKKTDTEQFVDRFSGYYTPTVVVLAILTAAVPPLLIDEAITVGLAGQTFVFGSGWQTWFIRGLTLLVIACPCAFVISTPVSVVSGITSAAKNGVLIKGGNYLEAMGEVDVVALDKTGTLTKGELAVTDVVPVDDNTETELLRYAAGLEQRSEHPIADAILAHATDNGVDDLPEPERFESLTGKGIRAEIAGETYYAGKPALFEELGFDLTHAHGATDGGTPVEATTVPSSLSADTLTALEREGKTVVVVGTETALLGVVAIADEVRPASKRAVERLHELGVEHVVLLTGDNEGTARAIAETVGVDEYRAELLPEEKVTAINALQTEYGGVAMVGDGINDAPALATAEVGIAMGAAGTDTALETADIALMGDDIGKLPYLYALSHTANGVIRQNIVVSLGVKALLAIGVPIGLVSVAVAVVIGDMGMSLGVTGNALRLSRVKPDRLFSA